MSVHNGERWVAEAVESVLRQAFANFEFIVVDDGSTDRTGAILNGYGDARLKVLHQEQAGLTRSLNRALRLTTAPLVARMDADDVALPERFAKQVAFLDSHPEVGLLGTGCHEISPTGEVLRTISPPVEDGAIRRALIRRNLFIHSSAVMRREVLETVGGYDETLPVAQDYDLWLRMSRVTKMANLPEVLLRRRLTPGRISSARESDRFRAEVIVKLRAFRSGAYPLWCAVFLAKPLCALVLPARLRQFLRRALSSEHRAVPPSAHPEPGPLRVLHLLVSTTLGGGPKHVFDLIRRLPKEEFSVVIGAPADGPFFERFRSLGVEVAELPLNQLRPWTLAAVGRLVRDHRIQVVHSHGKGAGLYGRLVGWWTGVPALHTFHGIHYSHYPPGLRQLYLSLERRLARLSYAVIHVSESQAREAEKLGLADPERSRVVVNGIDAKEVRALAEHAPLSRAALGLPTETQILGCVARFDQVKGLDVLLESLRRLAGRYPKLCLVLAGSGAREGQLRKRVARAGLAERVRFTGSLDDPPRLFPALDLYVSASRGEGLPLSLLEAMACGLPVVATRVTGHVDVVVDGMTGFLTHPGDPEALAMHVARLLDDPELRQRMGRAGSERVEAHFRLEPMVDQLARLYREAAAAGR